MTDVFHIHPNKKRKCWEIRKNDSARPSAYAPTKAMAVSLAQSFLKRNVVVHDEEFKRGA